jgi:antitoxin ParD1/3/4
MPSPSKRTFSLPTAQARYIDRKVKSGAYASASEVVRAGLRALQERDEAMERWLREEVVPVCDEIDAGLAQTISADELTAAVYAHHARRTRKSA